MTSRDPFRAENEAYVLSAKTSYGLQSEFRIIALEAAGHTDISKFTDEEWAFFVEQIDPHILWAMVCEWV